MVSGRVADGTFEGSFPENVVNVFAEGVAEVVVGGTFEGWLPEDVANVFSEKVADGAFEGASLEDIGTFWDCYSNKLLVHRMENQHGRFLLPDSRAFGARLERNVGREPFRWHRHIAQKPE